MKYSTYNWDLVQALVSVSTASCKTPAPFIDSIHPNINQKKSKTPEIWWNSQQIRSYCLGLYTQNPALREVVARSICWNKEEQPQKKTNCIIEHKLIYVSQHSERNSWNWMLRQEPTGPEPCWAFTDLVEACILNSLPTKSHASQPGQTLSDCFELEKSLTKSSILFSISKQTFPKLQGQLNSHDWSCKWDCHTER